jgi:hypothetical protein
MMTGLKGFDAWLTTPPEELDWDYDTLRNKLRELNEGRNLKTYYTVRQGTFKCAGRDYVVSPKNNGHEVKRHSCICGKRHRVKWESKEYSRGCFDIISFGWKDADLDPTGCTGIEQLENCRDETVTIVASGHKTVCPIGFEDGQVHPVYGKWEGDFGDMQTEIVCGAGIPGNWSGDDWSLSDEYRGDVDIIFDDDGEPNYEATAKAIIEKSKELLKHFYEECQMVSDSFDNLFNECQESA